MEQLVKWQTSGGRKMGLGEILSKAQRNTDKTVLDA